MEKDLINTPDADRLIFGLRDTGYNFNTAAADIIDNSIAADADHIEVSLFLESDGRKLVIFADNGHGMTEEELHKAMRYGAPPRDNPASLGKFGLGLKTASSSVCRRYTVISRRKASQDLAKLTWDLDHVAEVNKWEMLSEPVTPEEREDFEDLVGKNGTMVIWQKCDRLLNKEYAEAGGASEQAALRGKSESLAKHCALIYYRFLDASDKRGRNVTINIDGKSVEAWNPFFLEKSEQVLPEEQQTLALMTEDGETHNARIRAYILPRSPSLSKDEQKRARITNHGQGFYIHRENRVINHGGWLKVFGAVEPHTSLLRIEFDFDHTLDDAFRVDVKKSRILFDPGLEDALRDILRPIFREAQNRYRRKETESLVEGGGIDHSSSNTNIRNTRGRKGATVTTHEPDKGTATVTNTRGSLVLKSHSDEEKDVYVKVVDSLPSGLLFEPRLASASEGDKPSIGVAINKSHDFYTKIYMRARSNGYSVDGMDYLLWAFASAELNYIDDELSDIFEDIRLEIATNLMKILRPIPLPDEEDMNG